MDNSYKQLALKESAYKSVQMFKTSLPIMIGMLLIINLINIYAKDYYSQLFTGNLVLDPLIGAIAGSISFGIPIISYIVGGELLRDGVSLIAVSAFIMSWSTVGLAMLPLEAKFLGKRFAIIRNIINFAFAIIISILTIFTLTLLL